jgi:ATP-dependent protease Clp ATPase subunit
VCTWCGRPPSEVGKLVAGPKIYICDACATDASRRLATMGTAEAGRGRMRTRCSFCHRAGSGGRRIVEGARANVCDECLKLCCEFMQLDPTRS